MIELQLKRQYFEWIYGLMVEEEYTRRKSYRKLLRCLHDITFYWINPMDSNRLQDGINLRYRFGHDNGYSSSEIFNSDINVDPFCSVLEMMVALSLRCEDAIMSNTDIGDRSSYWFRIMVNNLGLGHMNDQFFDEDYVRYQVHKFLDRKIEKNGAGGLFVISDPNRDMRSADIWYQMQWFLNEYIRESGE